LEAIKLKVISMIEKIGYGHLCLREGNDPDLVQAFLKKRWVESDLKAPNLPLSLRFEGSGCESVRFQGWVLLNRKEQLCYHVK
jgi:hypothetical protein